MNGLTYDLVLKPFEMAGLAKLRAQLLSHAHGKTLEIGSGTGINLPYYPADTKVIGIEPDESMRRKSLKRGLHHEVSFLDGDAMALAFHDGEFDTVVGTLIFCTIPQPDRAMAEVYRVLKPGGSFLLLEHVRVNRPIVGRAMDLLTPFWAHLAGGCHLNRDPSQIIQDQGFQIEEFRSLWGGLGKFWVLTKPEKTSSFHP